MKQWFFFNYFNIVFTLSSTLLNAEDPFSRLGSLFKTFPPVSSKSCSIGCVQLRKPFTLPFSNVSLLKDSLFVSAWLESGKNAVRLEKISWIWWIPSPSLSVKIQIGGKVYLRLGDVNKLFVFKSSFTQQ